MEALSVEPASFKVDVWTGSAVDGMDMGTVVYRNRTTIFDGMMQAGEQCESSSTLSQSCLAG